MNRTGFQLVSLGRANALVDQLLADYQQHKMRLGLFNEYCIAVPSPSVANWLQAQIVARTGLCSGIRFVDLSSFLNQAFAKASDEPLVVVSKYQLTMVLDKILSALARQPEGDQPDQPVLRQWLANQPQAQSRVQLCHALADTYDLYQVFRPDWLDAWVDHRSVLNTPLEHWQAALWRQVCAEIPESYLLHRHQLIDAYQYSARAEAVEGLSQLAIFGVNQLHPGMLDQLLLLGEQLPVTFFWQLPSWCLFGEGAEASDNKAGTWQLDAYFAGNPLLASFGQVIRHQALQFDQAGLSTDRPPFCNEQQAQGAISLLKHIQSQIIRNHAESLMRQTPDESVTITAHYSKLREVEGLHDYLLDQCQQDASLKPDDMIVLCSDINAYIPYIHAVFDNQTPDKTLPYQLCGELTAGDDPASVMSGLIDLPTTRFSMDTVMDMLSRPWVSRSFDLNADEIALIQHWLTQAHAYWGLDRTSLTQLSLPTYDRYTLQSAVNRLVLGMCLDGEGFEMDDELFYGIEGLSALESATLSKLVGMLDALVEWRDICLDEQGKDKAYTVEIWLEKIRRLTNQWVDVPQKEADQLNQWYQLLSRVEQGVFDPDQPYSYAFIRTRIAQMVEEHTAGMRAWRFGRVNMGSFGALKVIPAKVTAILGLNETDFPRKPAPDSLNLMDQHPRLGDRSKVAQDKDAFLMALMNTEARFYASYVGKNLRTNAERLPSVVLQELLDVIQPDSALQKKLITFHPMKPYSDAYLKGDEALFTYQKIALPAQSLSDELALHDDKLSLPAWQMPDQISVHQLMAFLEDPAKSFFKARFNINLPDIPEHNDNEEPTEASKLTQWQFIEQLLQQGVIEGEITADMIDTLALPFKASASMSHDFLAEQAISAWGETAGKVLNHVLTAKGQKTAVVKPVDIALQVEGQSVSLVGDIQVFSDTASTDVIQWVHKEGYKVSEKYLMRTLVATRIAEALKEEGQVNYERSYLACMNKLYQLKGDSQTGKNALETWLGVYKSVMNAPVALDINTASGMPVLTDTDSGQTYRDYFNQVLEDRQSSFSKKPLSRATTLLCEDDEAVKRSEAMLSYFQYLKPGKIAEDGTTPHWMEIKKEANA